MALNPTPGFGTSAHRITRTAPYIPIITQLERAAGFRRDDTNEKRLSKLETILAQATNELSEAVPRLAELLSIPTGERYPPLNLTPQKRKEKTLKASVGSGRGVSCTAPSVDGL